MSLGTARGLFAATGTVLALSSFAGCEATKPPPGDAPFTPTDAGADSSPGSLVDSDRPADARPSLAKLIADDAVWVPLKDGGDVGLREGKVVPDPFPKRAWNGCGAGCLESTASPPFDVTMHVVSNQLAGEYTAGDTYLLLDLQVKTGRIVRIERLSDGATVAATLARGFQTRGGLGWRGGSAPLFPAIDDGSKLLFGRVSRTPGAKIAWHEHWLSSLPSAANERFGFDGGYGLATYDQLLLLRSPADTMPELLSPGAGLAHGRDAQLVWAYGDGPIRSYTVAGGQVALVDIPAPRQAVAVRVSDDRMTWIDAKPSEGLFVDARWHWSPRTTVASGIVVHDGPSLPAVGGFTDMHSTGVWAAADGLLGPAETATDVRIYLWNMASSEAWTLPNRTGRVFQRIFAVTPTELIVGERSTTSEVSSIDSIVRIELAKVPALISAWNK